MKKSFLFAAIVVFSVVACQKERPVAQEGNYTIRASRESSVDTRSTISDKGAFAWSAGDAIGLWNGKKFIKLTTNASGATADFTGTMVGTAQSYAVFPFALNANVESGTLKVTLPSSYEWKEGETNSPMLAECGENPTSLSFKHLGGLVKVSIKNVPADATKFVLTADKDIAGEYSVENIEGTNIIKSTSTEANNSVAFTFTAGIAKEMVFYVPVPVGEYKFTVALHKDDGTQLWSFDGSSINKVNRAKFILMPELTIVNIPATGEDHSGVVKESETAEVYRITTADGLVYAAANLFAQKKDGVYNIAADLDMTDKSYVAPKIDNEAGNFTLNGNGKTISNLGDRLIAETGSAKTVTIKDLTLDKANISVENIGTNATQGVAAFIGYAGTSENIVLENCHLSNSSIEANSSKWIGGLIGYAAGFNEAGNGPVFETVKITNCSVKGSTFLGGDSSVGSVIGHGIGDAATLVLIDNVKVSNNTISGTNDNKLGSVFGTVGSEVDPTAWNGNANGVHLDNSTIGENTVGGNKVSGLNKLYGRNFCNLWIDGSLLKTVSSQEGLNDAAKTPKTTIKLAAGTYSLTSDVADGVTFEGKGDGSAIIEINQAVALHGKNVSFRGVTVKSPNSNYTGIQHAKSVKYENCIIEGQPFSYAEDAVYEWCTFVQTSRDAYNIWTYGSKNITFRSCKFQCSGKSVLIYNEGTLAAGTVNFNDCEFTATDSVTGKAAIEIDSTFSSYEVNITNCTQQGFANGSVSGNPLWNKKKGDKTVKIVVDGTPVL